MHTCLLLHWVSAPLSDPAKSIRDNLNGKKNTYVDSGERVVVRTRERGRERERERERGQSEN